MRTEQVLLAWWRTRRAMRLPPVRLEHLRHAKWRALQSTLLATPALAEHAGKPQAEFPITEPVAMRADYGRWNSLGLTHGECVALADAAERGDYTGEIAAGWSTGTSGGARGLFLTTTSERADYIGQSLARLLPPGALLRRQRIGLHLRASNALYTDVRGRRIGLAHFPLDAPINATAEALARYDPTILIAPPHRLIALAQQGAKLPALTHLFYGSEPMSRAERQLVGESLGLIPQPIWQASEGFLGSSCPQGRLHLNEHALAIELEPVAGTQGFRPIITDLHRRSQPIVRLRGDDFIELDARGTCPCGYAGHTIWPVTGRVGDLWQFPSRIITPREVIEAVEAELGGAICWQALADQRGAMLRTAPDCPPELSARAAARLASLVPAPVQSIGDLPEWPGPKRCKVIWRDD